MSIAAALSNALSGLSAAARRSDVISGNVANALTEGYARRETVASAGVLAGEGAGVRIETVRRSVDARTLADRRGAEAGEARAGTLADAQARLSEAYGAAGEDGALSARATDFETALRALADSPESASLQAASVDAARRLVGAIGAVAGEADRLRMDADAAIAREVDAVNSALGKVDALNAKIRVRTAEGRETAALEEERQRAVDSISAVLPMRVAQRDGGEIALFTPGGAVLLDGRPAELGFTATGTITADMTLASGALSGLTLDGRPVAIGAAGRGAPLDGGSLAAHFQVRDSLGPDAIAQIDAVAADLVRRFEDPTADPTLLPGDAGLFTDAGASHDPLLQTGLAGRLSLNAAVDPDAGGDAARLRDGINAGGAGPEGHDGLLRALVANLTEARAAPAGAGVAALTGFSDLAGRVSALRAEGADAAETDAVFRQAQLETMREAEASVSGVDTDRELAELLAVEEAYAANARVIQVADALIKKLLEI
jgi:flagellar hook-associated protein 1